MCVKFSMHTWTRYYLTIHTPHPVFQFQHSYLVKTRCFFGKKLVFHVSLHIALAITLEDCNWRLYDCRDMLNGDLYLLRGNAATADQAPMEAACHPTFFNLLTLHGIFMTLAWGFFLQWGAFIARYLQHKKPLWLHLHRLFQVCTLRVRLSSLCFRQYGLFMYDPG